MYFISEIYNLEAKFMNLTVAEMIVLTLSGYERRYGSAFVKNLRTVVEYML